MSEAQLKRAQDLCWEYKDVWGETVSSISGGVRHFGVRIERNGAPLTPVSQRACNSKFTKELYNRYLDIYLKNDIVKRSLATAVNHSFLVEKPKVSAEVPKLKTIADLEGITDEELTKRY